MSKINDCLTPYLRWCEKNTSFYECVIGENTMHKAKVCFSLIRKPFAGILGLPLKAIKIRQIGNVMVFYVSKKDLEKAPRNCMDLCTNRDFANIAHGMWAVAFYDYDHK